MNYRHAFHAGNFADVVKHAALLALLEVLTAGREALSVTDTHAGAGLYDLGGPEALRSGEAAAGVLRLMAASDAPGAFAPLAGAVKAVNPDGAVRFYPGSPLLIARSLRAGDRYLACELRPQEHERLASVLGNRPGVEARCANGFAAALARPPVKGRELLLIDPPFERPDDYAQVVACVSAVLARNPSAVVMIWLPLKDLETFDAFVRDLEDGAHAPVMLAETRLRPLTDPMKMNGCVLALIGAPVGFENVLDEICGWVATGLGKDGSSRIWTTS